jgi:hypothetical protein
VASTARTLAVGAALLAAVACKPSSVADAEARGNVAWLDQQGTPDAVAALGRLADRDEKAVEALKSRAAYDVNAYIAAWAATKRNAAWGPQMIRAGLTDPARAENAATGLPRGEPGVAVFIPELEQAITRLAAGSRGANIAAILAALGKPALAAIGRLLASPITRGAMCSGVGSPEASNDTKSALLGAPETSRDHVNCVNVVIAMASSDDNVLGWLGYGAEPGLLNAAGKAPAFPCPRLQVAWRRALVDRAPETYPALSVPLQQALKRCWMALDPVLSEVLSQVPAAHKCIVQALDPYGVETADMKATCKALVPIANGRGDALVRERAADALAHSCKHAL